MLIDFSPIDRPAPPLGRLHAAVAVFYAAAALLNGPQIERAAERIEYGHRLRPIALALARPIAAAARVARLDRPRAWIERAAGRFLPGGDAGAAGPLAPVPGRT